MENRICIALALKDLIGLRLTINRFSLEQVLILINNELGIRDKFYKTDDIRAFADSILYDSSFEWVDNDNCLKAIQVMLVKIYKLYTFPIDKALYPNLYSFYLDTGINLESAIKPEYQEFKKLAYNKNENKQFEYIRHHYLRCSIEQVIFNYKPAEIGENDDDQRTKDLRRDLITNLGLVTGIDYKSTTDLLTNRRVICNYSFIVPSIDKADALWIGIMKELVRTIHELSRSTKEVKITNAEEVFNVALYKLTDLSKKPYVIDGASIFDLFSINFLKLNPINVFFADEVYCWAPTVVLTTALIQQDTDSTSNQEIHKGFIIFHNKDCGVAEMNKESLDIWQRSILKRFSDVCTPIKFNPEKILTNKPIILSVIEKI